MCRYHRAGVASNFFFIEAGLYKVNWAEPRVCILATGQAGLTMRPIIHIRRYALMFTKQADYLDIYSASFKVTIGYGKWQDVSKSHPEDGPN